MFTTLRRTLTVDARVLDTSEYAPYMLFLTTTENRL
jgi:hypothetical protein